MAEKVFTNCSNSVPVSVYAERRRIYTDERPRCSLKRLAFDPAGAPAPSGRTGATRRAAASPATSASPGTRWCGSCLNRSTELGEEGGPAR